MIINMVFNFTDREKSAIICLTKLMVLADGRLAENEKKVLAMESLRFGVNGVNAQRLEADANAMKFGDACSVVGLMTSDEKKYVCALLGALMTVDRDIDDKELALWTLISYAAGLPDMTPKQAVEYMAKL